MAYYNTDALSSGGMFNTPGMLGIGSDYYDNANEGRFGYDRFLNAGGARNSPFGNWMRNRYNRTRDEYGNAQGQNPALKWTEYLTQNAGNYVNEYANMTPGQRGEYRARTPKMRWL